MYDKIRLESLTSSPIVDLELHPLINLLLSDSLSWFSEISNDQELFIEILKTFSIILSNIESRCLKIDWVLLLVKDVPQLLGAHFNDFKRASSMVVIGKSMPQIFHGLQPHYGVDNPNEYTRKLADMLISGLLKDCESELIRYFLREILSQVIMMPLIDQLSEPDFFYEMFLAGSTRSCDNTPEKTFTSTAQDVKTLSPSNLNFEKVYHTSQAENPRSLFSLENKSVRKNLSSKGVSGTNITNSIVSGFNKLTLKGMDKVSSGIDKLKTTFRGVGKDDDSSPRKSRNRFVMPKREMTQETSSSPDKGSKSSSPDKGSKSTSQDKPGKQKKLLFKLQSGHKKKLSEKLDDFLSYPTIPRFFAAKGEAEKGEKTRKLMDIGSHVESGNISDSPIHKSTESNHRRAFSETNPISTEKLTVSPINDVYDTESEASFLDDKSLILTDEASLLNQASLLKSTDLLLDQTQQINEIVQNPKVTNSIYEYWKMLLYLYSEASLGPTKIGFLDLSRYSGLRLEDGLINLINCVFRFSERAGWMWTQSIFFMRPLANYFARSTINRNIVKAVYHVISPPQVAIYLALIRDIVWPNGVRPSIVHEKSADEKARTKIEAAQRILKIFQDAFGTILGGEMVKGTVADVINSFSVKEINKHLIFLLLDAFVIHFLPESVTKDKRQ